MCSKPTARLGRKSVLLAAIAPVLAASAAYATPFFMGSDISLLTFMQQQGVNFKSNGIPQQADQILYDAGNNLFRLRLFVNPQTTYTNSNVGAIQTTAYDVALAQQIKANDPSAKFELDLHYSDTWADPGHQTIPSAWTGQTLAQLQTSVYNYTYNTVTSFNAAGVMPDIVQVGNETNNGMLWPTGELVYTGTTAQQQASWAAYGSLVNSATAAIRAAQPAGPRTLISLVIGNGNSSGEPQYFYGNLTNPSWGNVAASSFDIMGVDYYPSKNTDITTLSSNLTALANTFNKKIMVMETDAPWENSSVAHDPTYAETQAGQAAYLSALAAKVQALPNNDGMGLLYWYPEAVQVPGYNIYNGGATALFDGSGNALQAVSDFNITQHVFNTAGTGNWATSGNWTNSTPNGTDVEADFLTTATSQTVSNNAAITLGTMRFQSAGSYNITGAGSLTLQATVGWGFIVVQQGNQQISVPTTIASNSILSVSAGDSLTFAGPVSISANQILKPGGTGTINYNSSVTLGTSASLTIGNSTNMTALSVATGANVTLAGSGLVLQTGSLTNTGTIDIGPNAIIINYGSGFDPIASIAAMIQSAYDGGAWNGTGITSSAARANAASYGVGFADSADPGNPAGLASGQIEILYTLLGDANLDGKVNGADFAILATNFNAAASGPSAWDQGDFNYDGKINGADFAALAANFNQGTTIAVAHADAAALAAFMTAHDLSTSVPEAAAPSLLLAGSAMLARQRRTRRR
jgi:arabinogalactan endo-1,4-beta-galactosidase